VGQEFRDGWQAKGTGRGAIRKHNPVTHANHDSLGRMLDQLKKSDSQSEDFTWKPQYPAHNRTGQPSSGVLEERRHSDG